MRWVFLVGVLFLAGSAYAVPFVPDFSNGPVVFDFEDGLQGWTASGSVTRVPTQALGGEWAILGDGLWDGPEVPVFLPNSLTLEVDLTNVASISIEQFFAGDSAGRMDFVAAAIGVRLAVVEAIYIGRLEAFPFEAPEPTSNPSIRTIDVQRFTGVTDLGLFWERPECLTGLSVIQAIFIGGCSDSSPEDEGADLLGFIDNVTFYPVPEPSVALLVALGLGVLAGSRRAR